MDKLVAILPFGGNLTEQFKSQVPRVSLFVCCEVSFVECLLLINLVIEIVRAQDNL
jgi:hypothetical protein